jgi:hypothetical protein
MRPNLLIAALLALPMLASFGVAAGEPEPITAASAHWVADGHVELKVTYQGGACEQPGEAAVWAGAEQTDEVTIPTVATAEVCTMQIVPVEFTGLIAVEPTTTTLAILILDFEGQPKAAGTVEITKGAAS